MYSQSNDMAEQVKDAGNRPKHSLLATHIFPEYLWTVVIFGLSTETIHMSIKIRKEDALNYHSQGQPGKIEVVPTKVLSSQLDLALAYSPGVAEPCKEIAANKEDVYKYTSKGNLVAVISNGTAVLGLGNIGPEASK